MSWFFESGGQSIGVSASASVLPMDIQDWFSLGWTGWISLRGLPFPSPGDLPDPGTECWSPALQADSSLSEPPGKPIPQPKREHLVNLIVVYFNQFSFFCLFVLPLPILIVTKVIFLSCSFFFLCLVLKMESKSWSEIVILVCPIYSPIEHFWGQGSKQKLPDWFSALWLLDCWQVCSALSVFSYPFFRFSSQLWSQKLQLKIPATSLGAVILRTWLHYSASVSAFANNGFNSHLKGCVDVRIEWDIVCNSD